MNARVLWSVQRQLGEFLDEIKSQRRSVEDRP